MRLSAFVIVSIFSYICFVLSLILNILLIVVRCFHDRATGELTSYHLHVILGGGVAAFVLKQQIIFIFILGPMGLTSHDVRYAFMLLYVSLFIFTCHQSLLVFFYRYAFIFRPRTPSSNSIYLGGLAFFAITTCVSAIYFLILSTTSTNLDSYKEILGRWANEILGSPNASYLIYPTDSSGKISAAVLLLFLIIGYIGIYVMHEVINWRLKSSRNAVSHSRTLQIARATIIMTAGTCFVGFLPYTVMMVCILCNLEIGVWAIPIPLGSAFIPVLAPATLFCKVDAYRSSLKAIVIQYFHVPRPTLVTPKADKEPA
ncbi:hypothetical protein Q1695_007195 [Nippostrongylus brasiliensis]|nr:hypothetical protein Q1695_007195 [Nippostrongylus brasiliensis]